MPQIGLYKDSDDSLVGAATSFVFSDNEIEFTADFSGDAYFKIFNENGESTSCAFQPVIAHRQYGDCIRMIWSNSNDVRDVAGKRDILYSTGGYAQEIFLPAYLNTPIHESNEIGTEKDGVFIPEKLIATPRQRVVAYVPRSTYEGLIPLPLADTITIWDEVGI